MLEQVTQEEYSKIDDKSARLKKGVDYIAGLVQCNREKLLSVLNKYDQNHMPNEDRILYDTVKKTIDNLSQYQIGFYGFSESELDKHKLPLSLGWVEVTGLIVTGGSNRPQYKLTAEGKEVYDHVTEIGECRSMADVTKFLSCVK